MRTAVPALPVLIDGILRQGMGCIGGGSQVCRRRNGGGGSGNDDGRGMGGFSRQNIVTVADSGFRPCRADRADIEMEAGTTTN